MVSTEVESQDRDEITNYEDLRSVGSSEATWHLMSYPITDRYPSVMALRIHLEDQQQVVFDFDTEDEALEKQRETELTAFFKFNRTMMDVDGATMPRYVDMPKGHVYDKSKKEWRIRNETGLEEDDTLIVKLCRKYEQDKKWKIDLRTFISVTKQF